MTAWTAFFVASFKQTLRNKQNLFWSLFFPVVFMVFIGFLGGQSGPSTTIAVIDQDGTPASAQVAKAIESAPVFKVRHDVSDVKQARQRLEQAKLDAVVVLPSGFGERLAAAMSGQGRTDVDVLYASGNYIQAQATRGLVESVVEHVGLAVAHQGSPIAAKSTPVGTKVSGFLDFLVPGLLAMMIMNSAVFAIAMVVTRWRDRGVLKRLRASALSPFTILSTWLANQSLTGIASVVILLALGVGVFGAHETILPVPLLVLVIMGLLAFFALGFLLAGLAKDSEGVAPIVNLVTLPMMFLSGVFFPVDSLPRWLGSVVQFLPLAFLSDGLRQTMNAGVGLAGLGMDLLGLACWLVVSGAVAVRFFRWE